MKVEWNKKYNTIALYTLIVLCLGIVFFQVVSDIGVFKIKMKQIYRIFHPFVIGFVMAYLFNFILELYENNIFKRGKLENFFSKNPKRKRRLGMVLTYITVLVLLYIFAIFVFPQIISSISGIVNDIPGYIDDTSKFLISMNDKLSLNEEYSELIVDKWDEIVNQSINFITNLVPMFANFIRNTLSGIWNIVIGVIVSIYLLVEKENFIGLSKKVTRGIFSQTTADWLIEIANRANYIFSRFLGGKILDSLIVGILTFIVLNIFKIPYPLLVAFIIGLTNIIPFFGPFIGAIPSTIIILFVSPIKAVWFVFIILIIQQIDGNIIGPKILGDSLGISAFWILFSLMITGKLMGFVGMIIGVPLFTLIYSIIKDVIEGRLEEKGLPVETSDYIDS